MDKKKILNMLIILAVIMVIAGSLTKLSKQNSLTLTDYVNQNPASGEGEHMDSSAVNEAEDPSTEPPPAETPAAPPESTTGTSALTGAALNGHSQQDQRITLADGFYYEPVSDALRRYMTGVSYPAGSGEDKDVEPMVSFEELRYVHILHFGFDGLPTEGELVCSEYIAQDITEIFYELYRNEYKLENVLLIDAYDGDFAASMTDNNTFCFCASDTEENAGFSKHAAGLAVDINPLYNPCVTFDTEGTETVLPEPASAYADRSLSFPYKIDENDLCCRLFTQYGFTWGGNLNDRKAYQHFQKTKP